MALYSKAVLEKIAKYTPAPLFDVERHGPHLEHAAWCYKNNLSPFKGRTPSELQIKLNQIARAAQRLLRHLGVTDVSEAPDGPGDREILHALTFPKGASEDLIVESTTRVGRLAEILAATEAAGALQRLSSEAVPEVSELAESTVRKGNSGEVATNMWIADLMSIYERITKSRVGTSIASSGAHQGEAGGPLIRFLCAAGEPLEMNLTPDALRSRIRQIAKAAKKK